MAAAAAASAATAALAALTTTLATTLTRKLARLSTRLAAGAGLTAGGGACSALRRLPRAWADIPIPRRAPFMISLVLATIAVASITTTSFCASLRASAIAVTAALTALGPARLSGMFPSTVAAPLATAGRAVS